MVTAGQKALWKDGSQGASRAMSLIMFCYALNNQIVTGF